MASPPPASSSVDEREVAVVAARVETAVRARVTAVLSGPAGDARLAAALEAARLQLEAEVASQLAAETEAALARARAGAAAADAVAADAAVAGGGGGGGGAPVRRREREGMRLIE